MLNNKYWAFFFSFKQLNSYSTNQIWLVSTCGDGIKWLSRPHNQRAKQCLYFNNRVREPKLSKEMWLPPRGEHFSSCARMIIKQSLVVVLLAHSVSEYQTMTQFIFSNCHWAVFAVSWFKFAQCQSASTVTFIFQQSIKMLNVKYICISMIVIRSTFMSFLLF